MITSRRWWPPTIRARLTVLYAGAFFLAGVTIVALMDFFLKRTLNHQLTERDESTEQTLQHLTPDAHEALMGQLQRARDDTFTTMLVVSLVVIVVVGIVSGGTGWILAGRALRPLRQITATARSVADRSLHERIALVGPNDEIKELADTLDAMLERIERSFNSQQRFVANASHELRTPLTINRTLIEVALDDPHANETLRRVGASLLAVNQRNEQLIDGLLTLASSEQRITNPTPVDLAGIALRVTMESKATSQSAGVEIRTDLQPAPVAGDPVLLDRLTQNLVDNAIRYNLPEQGWITITTGTIDDTVHLTVENTGPPVPTADVPSLFEPFRRLPTTERLADSTNASVRRGAGLGLSIVQAVARAHGGDVDASPRANGGLTVQVHIPKALEESKRNSASPA